MEKPDSDKQTPPDATAMRLRDAGLRPTRQRMALAGILFKGADRHITAEELREEAHGRGVAVSLATIYNTLHQFTDAGLLREVAIEGSKSYFDTNTGDHHHFFIEGENRMIDLDAEAIGLGTLPDAPKGMEIVGVDVLVRLRRTNEAAG